MTMIDSAWEYDSMVTTEVTSFGSTKAGPTIDRPRRCAPRRAARGLRRRERRRAGRRLGERARQLSPAESINFSQARLISSSARSLSNPSSPGPSRAASHRRRSPRYRAGRPGRSVAGQQLLGGGEGTTRSDANGVRSARVRPASGRASRGRRWRTPASVARQAPIGGRGAGDLRVGQPLVSQALASLAFGAAGQPTVGSVDVADVAKMLSAIFNQVAADADELSYTAAPRTERTSAMSRTRSTPPAAPSTRLWWIWTTPSSPRGGDEHLGAGRPGGRPGAGTAQSPGVRRAGRPAAAGSARRHRATGTRLAARPRSSTRRWSSASRAGGGSRCVRVLGRGPRLPRVRG